jgi:hypothetical protein
MMNVEFLKEQVERCRRPAREADSFTEKRLLALATEYEARIAEMEKGYRFLSGIATDQAGKLRAALIDVHLLAAGDNTNPTSGTFSRARPR